MDKNKFFLLPQLLASKLPQCNYKEGAPKVGWCTIGGGGSQEGYQEGGGAEIETERINVLLLTFYDFLLALLIS